MWENIKSFILRLFGKKPIQTDNEISRNREDVQTYADTTNENMTAIFAHKLATLAFGDSTIAVTGESKRAEYLNSIRDRLDIENIAECTLGSGMIASIPYSVNGKIYISTVMKDRIYVTAAQGDEITACTVLSDMLISDNKTYLRFTDYSLEGNSYIIRQRAICNNNSVDLSIRPEWANIPEEIRISGVDRLPIGIFKCPTSPRRPYSIDGKPITYGCMATVEKISKTLKDIEDEYDGGKLFIGVDETLLDKNGKMPTDRIFKKFISDGGDFWEVFNPAFRETAYFTKLQQHFSLLERQVGTSKGILTELDTHGATATEIRRAMYDSFCLCDKIHKNFAVYFDNLMYGVNVLCNYFGITPQGEYDIAYDWSYALLEDSTETFNQLKEGKAAGVIAPEELRNYIKPDETLEESAEKCAEIKKNNPTMAQIMGE